MKTLQNIASNSIHQGLKDLDGFGAPIFFNANRTLQAFETLEGFAGHNAKALLSLVLDSAIHSPMYPEETTSIKKEENNAFFDDFEETGEDLMTIFPNPASHQITLEFELPENTENAQLQVFGIDGRFVLAKTVNPKSTTLQLSVTDYANGIYVYLLTADGKLIARRKLTISK